MFLEFPRIFLLPTRLEPSRLHELEEQIPHLTYDIGEAEIIVGNITQRERALFELRRRKIYTQDDMKDLEDEGTPRKRIKTSCSLNEDGKATMDDPSIIDQEDGGEEEDEKEDEDSIDTDPGSSIKEHESDSSLKIVQGSPAPRTGNSLGDRLWVKVVKLSWLTESLAKGDVLPIRDYLVYEGKRIPDLHTEREPKKNDILSRAMQDAPQSSHGRPKSSTFISPKRTGVLRPASRIPLLSRQTSSEQGNDTQVHPIPPCLRTTYSCQRPTPANPPNSEFIEQLKKIRTVRTLIGDKIGVRAYSTSIAVLSAYPYDLQNVAGKNSIMSTSAK
jgi:DNA polymerase IV